MTGTNAMQILGRPTKRKAGNAHPPLRPKTGPSRAAAVTEEGCIEGRRTRIVHHVGNARIFRRNDMHEMELQPPWACFGVSGRLHTHTQITIGTWEISERARKERGCGPQQPQDAAAPVTRGWLWFPCASWPICHAWSTEEGRPTASDGRRRVVW